MTSRGPFQPKTFYDSMIFFHPHEGHQIILMRLEAWIRLKLNGPQDLLAGPNHRTCNTVLLWLEHCWCYEQFPRHRPGRGTLGSPPKAMSSWDLRYLHVHHEGCFFFCSLTLNLTTLKLTFWFTARSICISTYFYNSSVHFNNIKYIS